MYIPIVQGNLANMPVRSIHSAVLKWSWERYEIAINHLHDKVSKPLTEYRQ